MECRISDGQNTLDILNTENLIISTIIEKTVAKKNCQIPFRRPASLPSNLAKPHPPPLSISQHCMSGARFQNPQNEKVILQT